MISPRPIVILALVFAAAHSPAAAEEKLKVGFIGSFSGPAAVYGTACRNGFEMALDEGARSSLQVLYEDDQFQSAKTVSSFHKLVDIDKVDVIVTIGSTPSNAVAGLAQERGIPLFGWASDRRVSARRSLVVRTYPSGDAEGETAAAEALKHDYSKIGLLTSTNDYAQSWAGGVRAKLGKRNLVFDDESISDASDFTPVILKAKTAGVRQYALCLNPPLTGLFARKIKELGIPLEIFGCEYLHDSGEVESARGALDKAWFATITVMEDFQKSYWDRFKNDSILSGAANHYDLGKALAALPAGVSGRKLIEALCDNSERSGAVGRYRITETAQDRFFDIPLQIMPARRLP